MDKRSVCPPPLQRGDVIGIVAPAGQLADRQRFERGVAILADMGFEAWFPRELWPGAGYLADSDENRVRELQHAFASPETKAVMAARGGYGCIRLLEHLDFQVVRENPKPLIGFSDISALLNRTVEKTGLVCFHGPVVTSLCDCSREALERLHHCLTGNWHRDIMPKTLEILRGEGQTEGRLIGGNLSTLLSLLGTPHDVSWRGCIVVLEDIGEPLYRLDRMLTQLALSGKLREPVGIILGDFTLNVEQSLAEKNRYTEYVWKRVLELTAGTAITVWGNFPFGHCVNNLTLPLGATAVMDCAKGALRFA